VHKSLEPVCASLEALSAAVINGWTGDTTFNETWGWNCPALTRHDLAALAKRLAKRIQESEIEEIDASLLPQVNDLPRRLQVMQSNTVPQLYGGNCPQASAAYIGTIESLEKLLESILPVDIKTIEKDKKEAIKSFKNTLKTLRSIEARTSDIDLRSANLNEKIERIEAAHEAADQLPTDLESLKELRATLERLLSESTVDRTAVSNKLSEINAIRTQLDKSEKEGAAILERCDAAYRATTSEGLASAFAERSRQLNTSMWVWVFGLMSSLVLGAFIGSNQLHNLAVAIGTASEQSATLNGEIWIDLLLSVLSVGAPVWFAWVSTKQIGQRFRLAEDYGYKASISKAYEGYRREAAMLDPAFQARLFSSALTRLDEIPLRLVETDTHGSPWHELASSNIVRQAIDTVPGFMDKVTALAKQVLPNSSKEKQIIVPEQIIQKSTDSGGA